MMKNICQSCGMPLSKDPQEGGSNTNGSKNPKYCGYCYQNGTFTYNTDDVKEFQEHCRRMMIESGYNKFAAWLFSRGMKRLERWKN